MLELYHLACWPSLVRVNHSRLPGYTGRMDDKPARTWIPRGRALAVITVAALLAFAAWANWPFVDDTAILRVKLGMTEKEVFDVMGSSGSAGPKFSGQKYYVIWYRSLDQRAVVRFSPDGIALEAFNSGLVIESPKNSDDMPTDSTTDF